MFKTKTLIVSLGRTGSFPTYGDNIVRHFKSIDFDYLVSKNREFAIPELANKQKKIFTYTNKFNFIWRTFFYLPIKLITLIPNIYTKYNSLYIPYFHLWNLPIIILFKLLNKKIILTVHDGVLHYGESSFFLQKYSNYCIKLSDELIFLTKKEHENFLNKFNIIKPVTIIPHPIIDNPNINFENKHTEIKNLLFIGRISKYKGVELLVESVDSIKNNFNKLIIAGKSNYKIDIDTDNDKLQLIDKYLSEEEIGDLLNWADILIIPYLEASQSGVIGLGVYSELPMVCTNVGGLTEQLSEDECIWVEPNVESLTKGILKLINDKDKYQEIRQKIIKKKKVLSWENISEKVELVIENIITKN